MPTAEARIRTDRAGRYLTQLCRHISEIGTSAHRPQQHANGTTPPIARHVDYSDTAGVIDFGWARCQLEATDDALILRARADRPDDLQRLQEAITHRLEQVGHRDRLEVAWEQSQPDQGGEIRGDDTAAAR